MLAGGRGSNHRVRTRAEPRCSHEIICARPGLPRSVRELVYGSIILAKLPWRGQPIWAAIDMRRLQLLVLGAFALAQRGVSAGRSRHLLASNSSGYDDDHHDDHGDDHHGDDDHGGGHGCHDSHAGHHGKYAHFKGMLRCFGFALSVWTSGKLAAGLGIPSLVGEIICGIIIGCGYIGCICCGLPLEPCWPKKPGCI